MSGPHSHALYVHGHTRIHRLAPQCKLAAQFLFVIAVVATPREAFWAFGIYALVVIALIVAARLPLGFVAKRLVFEVPFILFAVLLPFVGGGERVEVFGLSLSVEGLWGAWNIIAKATLGLAVSIVVAATTTMPEFLRGFERLHMPRMFTSTLSFMIRYTDVIADEMRRMKVARISRGYDPRWIWQAKAVGSAAGTLFIRSYERGERVYLSMLSRGYEGTIPRVDEAPATPGMWIAALALPAFAALVAIVAWVVVA
jgi:cobalt/nickel transport system permease protein